MTKKDSTKLDDFDFGFTLTDIKDVDEVKEAIVGTAMAADEWKNKAGDFAEERDEWKAKAFDVFDAVMPLLDNLTKDKKDYIHWPYEIRNQKINEFIKKLRKILDA